MRPLILLLAGILLVCSCGGGSGAPAAAQATATLAAPLAFDNFGNSVGLSLSPGNVTNWPPLVAAAKNWTLTNHAVGSDQIYDQLTPMYASAVNADSITTFISTAQSDGGVNSLGQTVSPDAAVPGTMENWLHFQESAFAFRLVPDANKLLGDSSALQRTPNWTASSYWQHAIQTTSSDPITFSISGSSLYFGFWAELDSDVSVAITVDGTVYGPFNPKTMWTTYHGMSAAPYLVRIPGLSSTSHSISIQRPPGGSHALHFAWAGGNAAATASGYPRYYAANMYKANVSDTATWGYVARNAVTAQAVSEFVSDGFNIVLVDLHTACFDSQGNPICNDADGIHPGPVGAQVIFQTFVATMKQ